MCSVIGCHKTAKPMFPELKFCYLNLTATWEENEFKILKWLIIEIVFFFLLLKCQAQLILIIQ